jgi:hypothetical protein
VAFSKAWKLISAEIEYEASVAAGTFSLKTDATIGGNLAAFTIPAPGGSLPVTAGGPRTITISLGDAVCSQFQPRFDPAPTGTLIPRRGHIKCKRIGVYLDGARGEYWDCEPVALALGG